MASSSPQAHSLSRQWAVAQHADDAPAARIGLVRWTHGLVNRLVATTDAAALLLPSLALAFLPGDFASPLTRHQLAVIAAAQFWTFFSVMRKQEAYRVERYRSFWLQASQLLAGYSVALLVTMIAVEACLLIVEPLDHWFVTWQSLQIGLLIVTRGLQAVHIRVVDRYNILQRKVVVLGTGEAAERVLEGLSDPARKADSEVLGVFRTELDDPLVKQVADHPVLGTVDDLAAFAQSRPVDIVVLALPWTAARQMLQLLPKAECIAADIVIPFEEGYAEPRLARLTRVGGQGALQVASRPLKGSQGLLKAFEDYLIAATALIILGIPMLAIAVLIRLESAGPVLFLQLRTGLNQKPFHIYKFRTMTLDPNDDGSLGTGSVVDQRITRVGAILRKYSLDELPQLINVLRGEMSIVGPRPYVSNMLVGEERFSELVRSYAVRHRIKPGLTGWAQANKLRSMALRDPQNARRSIEMDLWYITNWSFWLDVKIILRTISTGLSGRNVV
ncbi:exopolysaccharide biosynthesis polyprenyl glycosylphosphotransferase [Roseomonas sp. KE2513]|uniref:exopolysaccharide biosynthesis polyprenyl glycosylphosphotransferase n=1 Tax=Roseomonas sp. KE2513 TaxID=2479202 RepID=UPI0018E03159|nr:exopolysaccharide biosynthesis polyprenyl glycosylphosphotransferase [Roseomonas sp. KE2513]MBI0539068.1 exopolysaccharide biosynthesis polyprenyl glycosylphosphotransferase [Roseomonas sp. KE2513]